MGGLTVDDLGHYTALHASPAVMMVVLNPFKFTGKIESSFFSSFSFVGCWALFFFYTYVSVLGSRGCMMGDCAPSQVNGRGSSWRGQIHNRHNRGLEG